MKSSGEKVGGAANQNGSSGGQMMGVPDGGVVCMVQDWTTVIRPQPQHRASPSDRDCSRNAARSCDYSCVGSCPCYNVKC